MIKNIFITIFLFTLLLISAGCSKNQSTPLQEEGSKTMGTYTFPGVLSQEKINNKQATIETSKGTIIFDLYADKAPKSVSNFVYLAEAGFYNGLTFHRVEPGFVIQGGDPAGNGTGGPGYQFPDEPVVGDYKAGTVAMANSGSNTNGSQFFICLDDLPSLPKLYNLFGQVTSGMDVVKKIQVNDKIIKITINDKSQ
jgi:cyclophilin family peptidyl-prolyl cis-trans isomerase